MNDIKFVRRESRSRLVDLSLISRFNARSGSQLILYFEVSGILPSEVESIIFFKSTRFDLIF